MRPRPWIYVFFLPPAVAEAAADFSSFSADVRTFTTNDDALAYFHALGLYNLMRRSVQKEIDFYLTPGRGIFNEDWKKLDPLRGRKMNNFS